MDFATRPLAPSPRGSWPILDVACLRYSSGPHSLFFRRTSSLKKTAIHSLVLITAYSVLLSHGIASALSNDGNEDPPQGTSSGKSIGKWVSCTGTSDDTAGVAKAFAAAKHGAFPLVVDCPVNIKVGMDIARPIFIDEGTTVEFTGSGKFIVDNIFIPAFVIADSSNITMTNWNVEYDAGLPIDQNTGGFMNNGGFVKGPKPANAFNDARLKSWLVDNRGIVFDKSQVGANPPWTGTTNACAVFFITGDSSNIRVTGMRIYVPASAGGDRFIPVAFSLGWNFKSNQTVSAKTPITPQFYAVPHDLTFSDINLDVTYMGWVGGLQRVVFENIQSQRYGDLQDANGGTVGGAQKWFAPPHLFYLSYATQGDPGLFNSNIEIKNVVDSGVRIGKARDAGGSDTISGYALSIKIGCVNCRVDNYKSARPDGFLDVLPSDGLTITNVIATYDSSFLNNLFPGWRFPSAPYKNVRFENIKLIDTAASSTVPPIGNVNAPNNEGITFKNVRVEMNHWAGTANMPLPAIAGRATDASMEYSIAGDASRIVRSRKGSVEMTVQAAPATVRVGTPTVLTWTAKEAKQCVAGGSWSGAVGTSGTRTVNMTVAGDHEFTLTCQNDTEAAETRLRVAVSP